MHAFCVGAGFLAVLTGTACIVVGAALEDFEQRVGGSLLRCGTWVTGFGVAGLIVGAG